MKKYDDLIDLPYKLYGTDPKKGVDCLWVAREVLSRMIEDFPRSAIPVKQKEIDAAIAAAMENRCGWRKVTWPDRVGDLVFGLFESEHMYAAVLVDPVGRLVITALPDRGVCLLPYRKLKGVIGTVRWVGL